MKLPCKCKIQTLQKKNAKYKIEGYIYIYIMLNYKKYPWIFNYFFVGKKMHMNFQKHPWPKKKLKKYSHCKVDDNC